MLSDSITLAKNATPDNVVYVGIEAGANKTVRKDVSGTYDDTQSLTISQQYTAATGVRRVLVRLDRKPDPTDELPVPRPMAAYLVFDFEDQSHPDAVSDVTEMAYQLNMFLESADLAKVLTGQH
jgi:hypothetical protein